MSLGCLVCHEFSSSYPLGGLGQWGISVIMMFLWVFMAKLPVLLIPVGTDGKTKLSLLPSGRGLVFKGKNKKENRDLKGSAETRKPEGCKD